MHSLNPSIASLRRYQKRRFFPAFPEDNFFLDYPYSSSQGPVRDQAVLTLVEIYRHVGERARTDLAKKAAGAGIADARLRTITARFDEVRDSKRMIADLDQGWFTSDGCRDLQFCDAFV